MRIFDVEHGVWDERLLSIGGGTKSIPVVGGGSFNVTAAVGGGGSN